MKNVRKISKKYYLRQVTACFLAAYMLFGIPVQIANATPSGWDPQQGTPNIGQSGNTTSVELLDPRTIINWDSLNTSTIETLAFTDAGGSGVLNRVVAGMGTSFNGALQAAGINVVIVDTSGITFGPDSVINARNFVASGIDILNADFMADRLDFKPNEINPYGDEIGNVINDGGTILAEQMAALIGQNVTNRGHIAGDYVIMAAGDRVFITGSTANNNVVVVTEMGDPGDYVVDNDGTIGDHFNTINVDVDHVILAAGDIWSTAISDVETLRAEAKGNVVFTDHIDVYADGGSDALADITIITGGDYTIDCDNEMTATAVGDGDGGFDATANITINAGGDVKIGEDSTEIFAYASEGVNNNASIEITAGGKVDVIAKESYVQIDAEAWDGTNNTADIKITANDGRVFVHGIDEEARIDADAWNGTNNTANVEITAKGDDGDVKLIAVDGGEAEIRAEAWDADNENTANIKIDADGDVKVIAKGYGSGPRSEAEIYAEATNDDEKNTADITINAGGDVWVMGEESGYASILAEASYGFENIANVTITTEDGYVLVHGIGGVHNDGFESSEALIAAVAEYAESKNSANVTITANGCEDCDREDKEGDVMVIAVDGGKAEIEAIAMNSSNNTADVTINADGEVKVIAIGYGSGPESEAEIMALAKNEGDLEHFVGELDYVVNGDEIASGTIDGLVNTANVDITAGYNVEVRGEDRGEAQIEAIAKNEIVISGLKADVLNLGIQNLENTAGVTITVNSDVTADFDTGNVLVTATEGGKAKIGAEAKNELDEEAGLTVNLTVGDIENDADVVINADDDVEVTANLEGSRSVAEIEVKAENELEDSGDTVNLTVAGLVANTAGIDITAGDTVLVKAEDGGIASIEAKTENDIDIDGEMEMIGSGYAANTANVKIDAEGSVKVIAEGYGSGPPSIAEIEVEAKYATDNTADITIDADCDVEVSGGVDDMRGKAGIEATAKYALNNNDADITINADNVKVIAGNAEEGYRGDAKIDAEAKFAGNNNNADVTITADGDVLLHAGAGEETAVMKAEAEYGYNNTANIGIVAGGNVEVIGGSAEYNHGGKAEMVAEAKNGYDNTAGITIDADGDVLVHGMRGDDNAKIYAQADDADNSNTANIGIDAGGSVEVVAGDDEYGVNGAAEIQAQAEDADVDNTATVTITAGDNVEVRAYDGGDAKIEADTDEDADNENTSTVTINAGDDVKVIAIGGTHRPNPGFNSSSAEINADSDDADNKNTSELTVNAGGDVEVRAEDGGMADIDAEATDSDGGENIAKVTVNAGGDVKVIALGFGSGPPSEASIEAEATNDDESNTAEITINAGGDVEVRAEDGGNAAIEAEAYYGTTNDADVTINAGGDVKVIDIGGNQITRTAKIRAAAYDGEENTANVTINAGDVLVSAEDGGHAEITAIAKEGYTNTADVTIRTDGDVEVIATGFGSGPPSEAKIEAVTLEGFSNTSGVLICAEGEVVVEGVKKGEALIKAIAHFGHINDAYVGIKADVGVEVLASHGGEASILSKALFGYDNDAFTRICTGGGILVIGEMGGDAEILAEAIEGVENDAYVAVCAVDDIIVAAGFNPEDLDKIGSGGSATIKAEAEAKWEDQEVWNDEIEEWEIIQSSANAKVTVISHGGGVAVIDIAGGDKPKTALIEAEAHNAYYNTADVGVSAGGDLLDDILPGDSEFYDMTGGLGLGVLVAGLGYDSKAGIFAYAHDGQVNTADVVVCTPDIVAVIAHDLGLGGGGSNPFAQIKSRAGAYFGGDGDATNTATTQVYAGDVFVYVPTIARGRGIWASAVGTEGMPHVDSEFWMTEYDDEFGDGEFVWAIDNFSEEGDDSATLIVKDFSQAVDCPTCPPCPDCDEEGEEQPLPALYTETGQTAEEQEFLLGGCDALMQWLAGEIGVPEEQIQVYMANAFALATDIQPCEACARLYNASTILADEQGTRIAAMAQVVNEFVTTPAPPSDEQMALIASSFSEHVGDGSYYADAGEWIDALAEYVGVMTTEMGFAAEDAAGFVTKYITPVAETGDVSLTAFVEARLAVLGG